MIYSLSLIGVTMKKNKQVADGQIDRFRAAAADLGCDTDEAKFNAALGKVARHKPTNEKQSPVNPPKKSSSYRP
jgi:hypothetical protein